jgi:hypothetical protein
MKQAKDRGCVLILLIGLFAGIVTGTIAGINIASWNYAAIISEGYTEVIASETGGYFVRYRGEIYRLETVNEHEELNDKIGKLYHMLKEHDENDAEEFKKLKGEINHDTHN